MIPYSDVPAIAELQKDTEHGCCCFCQERIPNFEASHRKPVQCGGEECVRSYKRLYARYYRRNVRPKVTAKETRSWYEKRRARFWTAGLTVRGVKPKIEGDVRRGRPRARSDRM